jgi:hypothetical protein
MNKLTDSEIEILEKFIADNTSRDPPAVSPQHLEERDKSLKEVSKGEIGSYYIFGGNGLSSYAHYKGEDGRIYTIVSFIGELSSYSVIK